MYKKNKKILKYLIIALFSSILLIAVTASEFFVYAGTIILTAIFFGVLLMPLTKSYGENKHLIVSKIGIICNIFSFISISVFSIFTEIELSEFVNILFTLPLFISISLAHIMLIINMKDEKKVEKILKKITIVFTTIAYIIIFLMVSTIVSYDLIYYMEIQILIMLAIIFTFICLLNILIRKLLTLILN